ncbi:MULTISPECIES: hypothetical protein [unclassified Lentimicrobium]|uniref:hypothetical protein n=1 Tax=unclassified Lentimicrobium TaxID=2677434 RepID=UPI0015519143|nr:MULTISPECIES: hypothetical protein [unclassified Lentimicrobium]NPD46917.1 hypothetical protein [Lentimicrobium sp. S6]NPD84121.1 hypothetical protein [Lentimicrobium sp. L6]
MKKLIPYQNINTALKSLDNGGRFYNILTKAEDGIISQAELGKVGGIFGSKQQSILFLEMSISALSEKEEAGVLSQLDDGLQKQYQKHKAQHLQASEANKKAQLSSNAIITGIPKLTDSKTDFMGFIMMPISTGEVTTFSMIPLIDQYDVYELRDESSLESFFIAHARGSEQLPAEKITVGGVIKEMSSEEEKPLGKFLETVYYMEN